MTDTALFEVEEPTASDEARGDAASIHSDLLALAAAGDPAAFWRALRDDGKLQALRALRASDPAGYLELRAAIKASARGISVTQLDGLARGDVETAAQGGSVATTLVELACERCTLWHDAAGEAHASLEGPLQERQHWPLTSPGFRDWLSHLAYRELGAAPGTEALKATLNALAGAARFEGETAEAHRRVAKTDDGYWLDLCDERWRAIQLTPDGWRIVDHPPVRFVRGKTAQALPMPAPRGDVAALWELLNVPEGDRLLVLAWLLECWRADTPYLLMEITGEQGAAKSTAQRTLRLFVDPDEVPLRGRPKAVEDLYVAAGAGHLLSFENLSTLSADQSDALCAILTGAGFAARRLYTDHEEVAIRAHRPAVVNGITPVVLRPDLLDRTISLHLPRIRERRTDEELALRRHELAPAIMAGLLDLFCAALRLLPKVKAERLPLPRMADFAQWGEAVARALGHPGGAFLDLYGGHRRDAIRRTLDSSPVAVALEVFARDRGPWRGTVGRLLEILEGFRPKTEATDFWPRSPKGLGDALRRYSPALAVLGIEVNVDPKPSRHGYMVTIKPSTEHMPSERPPQGTEVNNVHNVNGTGPATAGCEHCELCELQSSVSAPRENTYPGAADVNGDDLEVF